MSRLIAISNWFTTPQHTEPTEIFILGSAEVYQFSILLKMTGVQLAVLSKRLRAKKTKQFVLNIIALKGTPVNFCGQ
jgi:hypothetical protein